MAEKSKILIIGATGYIGKYIVQASIKAGHPTFALVRETAASNPEKSKLIDSFKSSGATLLYRFLPIEFGFDVDRHHAVKPAASFSGLKVKIKRAIEAEGIPYTYIISNAFAGYFLTTLGQQNVTAPPRDKAVILGDRNVKESYVTEEDVGIYTIKAVDDPRTLNKILYLKPLANLSSFNKIISLWESKIGETIEKTYVPKDQIFKDISESPFPVNLLLALRHSLIVKGDVTNFEIEASFGVEASELYPEVNYTTANQYLDQFV